MRWLTNFYDFTYKSTATAGIGIHPDCYSWWISKMQSDTLEEQYAIKFCFKLGNNATETDGVLQTAFRPSCMNRISVFEWHKRFKEGRDSVRDDERCGRSKQVRTHWVPLSYGLVPHLSKKLSKFPSQNTRLVKGLGFGLGLLCWGFKGVQKEIPSEEASTLQMGSVAFPAGQCTSPQLHPCHRHFDQDGHQDSSSASL